MSEIRCRAIGVIRSPHTMPEETPIQPVFATRSPCRPNGLGMSLVRLVRREGHVLHVEDLDVLDGTPLLDIKPYIGRYDCREDAVSGWQEDIDDDRAEKRGRRGFRGSRG